MRSVLRHKGQDRLHEVAVRVQKRESLSALKVLADEVGQERGLSRAGLPHHPQVAETVRRKESEARMLSSERGFTENQERLLVRSGERCCSVHRDGVTPHSFRTKDGTAE